MFNLLVPTAHGLFCVNRHDTGGQPGGGGAAWLGAGGAAEASLALLRSLLGFLPADGVCLDIGAHVGLQTLALARHFTAGRVYAFEPQRLLFCQLAANMALNSVTNAYPQCLALGRAAGVLAVPELDPLLPTHFGGLELGRAQVEDIGQWPEGRPVAQVPLATVDGFGAPPPALLSIGVEGMALDVVEGARRTLVAHRPLLVVDYRKGDAEALLSTVKALAYDAYLFQPTAHFLFVPRERMKLQGVQEI